MTRNTSSPLRMSWACPSVTVNRNSKGKKNVLFVILSFWMGWQSNHPGIDEEEQQRCHSNCSMVSPGPATRAFTREISAKASTCVQQVFHLIAGRSVGRGCLSRDGKGSA